VAPDRPLARRPLNRALLAWHGLASRSLPVREAATPWAVLVVEVMSQQTQIERVGPAWRAFVERWPSPTDLAAATTPELLRAWAGLGYNRRALALRDAARAIVDEHGGAVPSSVDELERLPGIGPYTARAVAAVAFGRPIAPVDVNVRRVIGRVVCGTPSPAAVQVAAVGLVDRRDPRGWVNAVMDLAATVCVRRSPSCGTCPVAAWCASRGIAGDDPPARAPRQPFPETSRWLRGRVLAALRDAPDGTWTVVPDRIGDHGADAVAGAIRNLEAEGFLELRDGRARIRTGP
jgi:A/G-specific adenine glycosylase